MRCRCLRGGDGVVVPGDIDDSFGPVAGAGAEEQQGENSNNFTHFFHLKFDGMRSST